MRCRLTATSPNFPTADTSLLALSFFISSLRIRSTSLLCPRSSMSMKSMTMSPPMSLSRSWRAISRAASRFVRKAVSSMSRSFEERPEFTSMAHRASVRSITM